MLAAARSQILQEARSKLTRCRSITLRSLHKEDSLAEASVCKGISLLIRAALSCVSVHQPRLLQQHLRGAIRQSLPRSLPLFMTQALAPSATSFQSPTPQPVRVLPVLVPVSFSMRIPRAHWAIAFV